MSRKNGRAARRGNDTRAQARNVTEAAGDQSRAATIARLAYERWQARGCPSGDDQRDWLEAEQEVLAGRGARSEGGASAVTKPGATS